MGFINLGRHRWSKAWDYNGLWVGRFFGMAWAALRQELRVQVFLEALTNRCMHEPLRNHKSNRNVITSQVSNAPTANPKLDYNIVGGDHIIMIKHSPKQINGVIMV